MAYSVAAPRQGIVMQSSASQPMLTGAVVGAPAPMTISYPQTTTQLYSTAAQPLSYVPPIANAGISEAMFRVAGVTTMPGAMEVRPPPPNAPERLTTGIPDPGAIESQKAAYSKGLDDQLRQGAAILNQQLKQQMEQLHQLGEQQKKKYFVQVDHEIKSQELGLMQQFKEQLLMVQQAASQQKRILGQQATQLLLEYNQKKAQEDLLMEEYQIAKSAYDSQVTFSNEFQSLQQQQQEATQAALVQQQAVEQHAAAAMAAIEEQRAQVAQQMAAQSRLVQSAETTAAAATAMYGAAIPPYAGASLVAAPTTVSYAPGQATTYTMAPSVTPSYIPAPVLTMPTVSYTPAPAMMQPQVTYAPVTYAA